MDNFIIAIEIPTTPHFNSQELPKTIERKDEVENAAQATQQKAKNKLINNCSQRNISQYKSLALSLTYLQYAFQWIKSEQFACHMIIYSVHQPQLLPRK